MCLSVHNSQEPLLLLLYWLKCYQIYTQRKSNGSLPIVLKVKVVFTRIATHARVLVRFYWNLQTVITSGTFTQTDQWTVMEWRWPTSSLKFWLLTFCLLPPCLCSFISLLYLAMVYWTDFLFCLKLVWQYHDTFQKLICRQTHCSSIARCKRITLAASHRC